MLSKLVEYVETNGLSINIEKTKCIIFNKTGRFIRRNFKINECLIKSAYQRYAVSL